MFMIIPTFSVEFSFEGESIKFRVPKDNLEAFIHVLLFNGVDRLVVESTEVFPDSEFFTQEQSNDSS